MERRDLKKLALMGLTSGMLLATQGHATVVTAYSNDTHTTLVAGHKCGKGGCGGRSAQQGCGGRPTAMLDTPTTERVQRYPNGARITKEKLRDQLNVDTKKIFDTLPEKGKTMVLEAVNKEPTRNKNDIVKSIRDQLSQDSVTGAIKKGNK